MLGLNSNASECLLPLGRIPSTDVSIKDGVRDFPNKCVSKLPSLKNPSAFLCGVLFEKVFAIECCFEAWSWRKWFGF